MYLLVAYAAVLFAIALFSAINFLVLPSTYNEVA